MTYREFMEGIQSFGMEVKRYDEAKKYLTVSVCNAEKNAESLKNVPHEIREDLALVYHVKGPMSETGAESLLVNNVLLGFWEIGEQQLKEDAWENMKKINAPHFCRIKDILDETFFDEVPPPTEEKIEQSSLYVLTNKEQLWGAVYMFDAETMADIAENIGSSLIVLPSSVDEILILPESENMNVEAWREMVKTINAIVVQDQDILSDQIYRYDKNEREISILLPSEQAQGMRMNL